MKDYKAIGRKGGLRMTKEQLRKIGKAGGLKVKATRDADYFRRLGAKGGAATKAKHSKQPQWKPGTKPIGSNG